jgi:hypothetical protein
MNEPLYQILGVMEEAGQEGVILFVGTKDECIAEAANQVLRGLIGKYAEIQVCQIIDGTRRDQ